MKQVYKISNLDCAACALKLEEKINKIDGVISCSINFLMQKMILEIKSEAAIEQVKNICLKFEDGIQIKRVG